MATPNDALDTLLTQIDTALVDFEPVETAAVAASLDTDATQGANAALIYTAVTAGADGNSITIALVDDGAAGSETVDVAGTDIVVHVEAGVSTADQVKAAIAAHTDPDELDADELVTVTDKAANDGSGVVTAFAEDAFEGGADASHVSQGGGVNVVKATKLIKSARRRLVLARKLTLIDT